jgi:hypothetical protein
MATRASRRSSAKPRPARFSSRIFHVALQQLDRDALWPADEADPDARPDCRRLFGKFYPFGLDLGGTASMSFTVSPK